jgi:hypothetical protein
MSYNYENLKEEAWTAFAAVKLCKALEAAFEDWNLQASSPITVDIGTTAKLVQEILECEDQAVDKEVRPALKRWIIESEIQYPVQAVARVFFDIQTAHQYWSDCLRELWEPLKPKLGTLPENKCKHATGKMCTSCKLQRRTTLYSFLWADFVQPSVSENRKYFTITEQVLENTLMVIAARGEQAELDGPGHWYGIAAGEGVLLTRLEKLWVHTNIFPGLYWVQMHRSSHGEQVHPRAAEWHELWQSLLEHSPAVRTRVQNRHEYEAVSDPGVAAVDA